MAKTKNHPAISLKNPLDSTIDAISSIDVNGFKFDMVPITSLVDNDNNFFSVVEDESLAFLTESIIRDGIQNPLIVRPYRNKEGYEIISGHRRKKAAESIGLSEVPVFIAELSDEKAMDLMVSTNFHRLDLKPTERARMYKYALDARNHRGKKVGLRSIDEVSKNFNASEATIKRYIALLTLDPEIQRRVDSGELSLSKATALSKATKNDTISNAKSYPDAKAHKITLLRSEIEQYLPGPMNDSEIKEHIIQLLKDNSEVNKSNK